MNIKKIASLSFAAMLALSSASAADDTRSFKRGFGENTLSNVAELNTLKEGCTWFYNWGNSPNFGENVGHEKGIEFIPMAWNANYNTEKFEDYYKSRPNDTKYLLGFNEPNFPDQANMTPEEAAEKWKPLQDFALAHGYKLVGPAMNYAGAPLKNGITYSDPTVWMDEFIAAYKKKWNEDVHFDYTAVHAYMDAAGPVMSLINTFYEKYGKQVWLTEFCSWTSAKLTPAKQMEYAIAKLKELELSDKVYRYAWFKAKNSNVYPYYNLLEYPTKYIPVGTLTDLGFAYIHMSTFYKDKYYAVNERIPANNFVDCASLKAIQKSIDPQAIDSVEVYSGGKGGSVSYQLNVPEAGDYTLIVRASCATDGKPSFNVIDENKNTLASKFILATTGGLETYAANAIPVTLKAGQQTITLTQAVFGKANISLVKLVKNIDENDKDMETIKGTPIVKPSDDDDDDPSTPTEGDNESYDKEVVVTDATTEPFNFADDLKFYTIFLDGKTSDKIADDNIVNLGDNGSGHQAHLVFGSYDLDGREPVANFKRDGKWHNVDIPMSYLQEKYGLNFGKDNKYNNNILCINGGSRKGYNINFDAAFFYGPKDGTPDEPNDVTKTSIYQASVSDEPFQFVNDEKYYIVFLDETTRGTNLSKSQIVDLGPNGSTRNLYPWENTATANEVDDANSFGITGNSYMSWKQAASWFGLGYNIAASKDPVNLSGINKDYFLHIAVKTKYEGPILFAIADAAGKSGNIVLGKEKYHDHAPVADFPRDGKWHNIEVPVNMLSNESGISFKRSVNFTGNILTLQMSAPEGTSVDYDAIFFHGPKNSPAYATEKGDTKKVTITKASEKPFSFANASEEDFYVITMDDETKLKNIPSARIKDIGPDEQTRFLYPWDGTVSANETSGKNSYGVEGAYSSWSVGNSGWSGLGFFINRNGLTSLAGINKDYTLHFAVKSTTTQSVRFIIVDGNGKEANIVLGKEKYGDLEPIDDFERDNTWYNIDVPVSYLITQGLDFRTAKAYGGNIFSVMCGNNKGEVIDYDAVFFYGPKGTTPTGIEEITISDETKPRQDIPTEIFDLQGRKVQRMETPGIYIIRSSAGIKKVLKR